MIKLFEAYIKNDKFIKLLDKRNVKYYYENRWLIIKGKDIDGFYELIKKLPGYIKFNNDGWIDLSYNNLISLPKNIIFNNNGNVDLSNNKLTSLPDNIQFNNNGKIFLINNPLKSLPNNIDEWFDKLSKNSLEYLENLFPKHYIINSNKYNL